MKNVTFKHASIITAMALAAILFLPVAQALNPFSTSMTLQEGYYPSIVEDAQPVSAQLSFLVEESGEPVPVWLQGRDKFISLRSVNYPKRYIRHRGFEAHLDENDNSELFRKDATFKVVSGLANCGDCISFESVNYPGRYLRHRGFEFYLDEMEDTDLFRKDASFKRGRALAECDGCVSFESVNYPGYFIRHQGFRIKLHEKENTDLYKKDVSFYTDRPLHKAN